jgi:hypothetical protein
LLIKFLCRLFNTNTHSRKRLRGIKSRTCTIKMKASKSLLSLPFRRWGGVTRKRRQKRGDGGLFFVEFASAAPFGFRVFCSVFTVSVWAYLNVFKPCFR